MKKLLTFVLILASVQAYGQSKKEPDKLTSIYDYGDTLQQRYFIISYHLKNSIGDGFGQVSWNTIKNEYINRDLFDRYCKDSLNNSNVVILNIIELNKKDIEMFNLKITTK